MTLVECLDHLLSIADERKGFDIQRHDVQGKSAVTEFIAIISVKNPNHCRAIVEALSQSIKGIQGDLLNDLFIPPKVSGTLESGWVILDANSILIHIILSDLREYYAIDQLFVPQGLATKV